MSGTLTDLVKEAFAFLEAAGFRLVSQDQHVLRYHAEQVVLTVVWDSRSGELDVLIGLRPKAGKKEYLFSLTDVLRMEGVEVPERRMPFQVADERRLGPFIQKLAHDTRVHAQPAVAGDRMFFRRLQAFTTAQARVWRQELDRRDVRSKAEQAWRSRQFGEVIDLYASIEALLTNAEKKKLDYARKHQRR